LLVPRQLKKKVSRGRSLKDCRMKLTHNKTFCKARKRAGRAKEGGRRKGPSPKHTDKSCTRGSPVSLEEWAGRHVKARKGGGGKERAF